MPGPNGPVGFLSRGPTGLPSLSAFVARFLGRTLSYIYEVRESVPRERFVMSPADGPFAMETTYTWRDAPDGGTHMSLRNRGEPSGFSAITAPPMAGATRRANRLDLLRLKALLAKRDAADTV